MTRQGPAVGSTGSGGARWPVPALLGAGLLLFFLGLYPEMRLPGRLLVAGAVSLVFLVAYRVVGGRFASSMWGRNLARSLRRHSDALDELPERHLGLWIGLASAAGLFIELMLIRWHASVFQLFAYFKNVTLLAAFLGLGIGYALGRRRPVLTPLVLPALAAQFLILTALRRSGVERLLQTPVSEQQSLGMDFLQSVEDPRWVAHIVLTYGFLVLVFAATVLTCVPLGHLASRLMLRRPPLVAYGWNLAGAVLGVLSFSLLAWIWSPPIAWLAMGTALLMPFLMLRRLDWLTLTSLASVGAALVFLALPVAPEQLDIYSPYQILSLTHTRRGLPELRVNHVYFQRILDLRPAARADSQTSRSGAYYDLPYRLKPAPDRVLVLGSGTGNDVAAALRAGARRVDAVEIDPAVLELGSALHPEAPYQDPRVIAHVQDARAFIRRGGASYDLIVYGLLDSHTLLSGMSSVRLDSFVYTVEAFREAREILASDGVIAMTFSLLSQTQGRKFFLMLQEAFDGREPLVFGTRYDLGFMFVIGPGVHQERIPDELRSTDAAALFRRDDVRADISTDDWPFIYMPVRTYPSKYLLMVAVLTVAALLLVSQLLPVRGGSFAPVAFLLGTGFMLVETKGITELALVFGSTWQVTSVVVVAVLVMAFLANLLVIRVGAPALLWAYAPLVATLLLGVLLTPSALQSLPLGAVRILSSLIVTVPVFFSGLAFSGELRRLGSVPAALSSNLLGAMAGGFLEYNSLYFGFKSLYLFAVAVYALAFLLSSRSAARR